MNPELARARSLARGLILVAVCLLVAAFLVWRDPPLPQYTGRFAWLGELAYSALGGAGLALLWIIGAVLTLEAARFVWRHTPKRPQDRLF